VRCRKPTGVQPPTQDEIYDRNSSAEVTQSLAALDSQQERIVELRYFAGLTIEETAEATGLSTVTVEREWRAARAWLYVELPK